MPTRKPIALEISNIPIVNLRNEFKENLGILRSPNFLDEILKFQGEPIKIPPLSWYGMPNDLLTLMLQRAVLGLEAYVSAAVDYELSPIQEQPEEIQNALRNPYTLHKKLVVAIYDKIPALVAEENKLSSYDKNLFDTVERFYKGIRNKIFHGSRLQLSVENYKEVVRCFEILDDVYGWVDTWYGAFTDNTGVLNQE